MPHEDLIVDGVKWPSVTEILSVVDKPGLYKWFEKLGTQKAEALFDSALKHESMTKIQAVDCVPDSWFENNNIIREQFWWGPDEVGEAAKEAGRNFHERVSDFLVKGLCSDSETEAISRWVGITKFKPLEVEKHVISKDYNYHGTFDALGCFAGGDLCLVDWKKANYIQDTYVVQLSAYARAYAEERNKSVDVGRIVRLYSLKTQAKEDRVETTKHGTKYSFKGSYSYLEERVYAGLGRYFPVFLAMKQVRDFMKKTGPWTI